MGKEPTEYASFDGLLVKKETEKAILVDFGDQELWFPKSQCAAYPAENETGTVEVAQWLAEKNGLI